MVELHQLREEFSQEPTHFRAMELLALYDAANHGNLVERLPMLARVWEYDVHRAGDYLRHSSLVWENTHYRHDTSDKDIYPLTLALTAMRRICRSGFEADESLVKLLRAPEEFKACALVLARSITRFDARNVMDAVQEGWDLFDHQYTLGKLRVEFELNHRHELYQAMLNMNDTRIYLALPRLAER